MMLRRSVKGSMVLVVLWLSAGGAHARDIFKAAQADVFVLGGGSTLVDTQYFASAERLFHSRFDLGPKFTVGVAVPYGKLLKIETAYSYGPNNLVVTNTNIFPHVGTTYGSRTYIGSLSAVIHSPVALFHIRPYGAGGVEYDRFSPTDAAIAEARNNGFAAASTANLAHNDKFGLNIGVGLDRKLTKRMAFRIDLRDHITSSPAFGIPPVPTSDSIAMFPVSGRANNIMYTAGFVFHLGKL
jgi:opacity protein-like surface antigen